MLVGTKEVSLSFFLFCCSASSLALASSVEMMFFIFALEEKQKKKYSVIVRKGSRHRSAKWMDLEASNSTAVPSDVVFERRQRYRNRHFVSKAIWKLPSWCITSVQGTKGSCRKLLGSGHRS